MIGYRFVKSTSQKLSSCWHYIITIQLLCPGTPSTCRLPASTHWARTSQKNPGTLLITGLDSASQAMQHLATEPIFALFEYWIFISNPFILYNASLILICWQEVDIAEPCSCICYSPDFVLFGTDTVYKLSVHTGVIRPFLVSGVKPNTSYHSLPIDILCVSGEATRGDNSTAELIVCFTGVYDESQLFYYENSKWNW